MRLSVVEGYGLFRIAICMSPSTEARRPSATPTWRGALSACAYVLQDDACAQKLQEHLSRRREEREDYMLWLLEESGRDMKSHTLNTRDPSSGHYLIADAMCPEVYGRFTDICRPKCLDKKKQAVRNRRPLTQHAGTSSHPCKIAQSKRLSGR